MFNAEELNLKQERIKELKRGINEACKSAKFKVDCGSWSWLDDVETFKLTGKTVVIPYMYYDSEYYHCFSDSLLDAIMTGYAGHNRPTQINNIKFKDGNDLYDDNPKYTFDFIPKHYETIINHPERAKLEMLLESLQVENIKLVEVILEGE